MTTPSPQEKVIKILRASGGFLMLAGAAIWSDIGGFATAIHVEDQTVRQILGGMLFVVGVVDYVVMPMVLSKAPATLHATPARRMPTGNVQVILKESGRRMIDVIKVIRAVTGFGLKEAKDMAESAPIIVTEDISRDEAEKIRQELESVGASVELQEKPSSSTTKG